MQKEVDEDSPPIAYEAYRKNYEQRMALRNINFNKSSRVAEVKTKTAQIKSIQKFIVKLKSESKVHEAILTEMDSLNLSKYLEEISSLIASCVSERQIRFFSEVTTRLNQEYDEIPAMIMKDISKQFTTALESSEDNKYKLKSLLLFLTELFVCGFTFPYKEVSDMLKKLVKAGTKKKSSFTTEKELRLFAYYYNCDSYASFLIHFGSIFTHVTPKWVLRWRKQEKQVPKYPQMIPVRVKDDITNNFFSNYITSCLSVLQAAFTKLKETEGELRENLRMSGQFNKAVESSYNDLKEKFIFTKKHLEVIIGAINFNAVLRDYEKELIQVESIMNQYINKSENVQIFQNEFEKQLYFQLPEFSKSENKSAGEEDYKSFKEKLDKCKNKSDSDDVVKLFEQINNKRTRKLIAKDLTDYRKEYQSVTPFLCRITTIIAQQFKDIQQQVLETIFSEYEKLRENINTNFVINDKRSRNLKYICELTKFKMIEPQRAMGCIQNLIDDLKGHNIELLIASLESIGRFLYLSPASANKFTFLLSKLQNVLKQKSFPLFTTSQLLNSISLLKPQAETQQFQECVLSEVEKQAEDAMQMDVIEDLDDMIREILKVVDKEGGLAAVQASLIKQIERYDFLRNYNYAFMISELNIPQIANFTIEKTQQKLEESIQYSNYQSSILWSRFFAQLYKYNFIKRSYLLQQLTRYINLANVNEILVINIVCTVFQSCIGYLQSKKLTPRNQIFMFLVDFRKFITKCLYIPMLEEFKIIDVFEVYETNLTEVKPNVLELFLTEHKERIGKKDFDISAAFDSYLQRKNLKEVKTIKQEEVQDVRKKEQQPEKEDSSSENNLQVLAAESKSFEGEFLSVMNSHIKDLSGKIAKPAIVEKVIERRKEKRKLGEGQKKIVVIARNGNKFMKKDIVFASLEVESKQAN